MNGYNFTDRVRAVLGQARAEANRLHHEYVGTEHILLGVIAEGGGVAVAVLVNRGIDPAAVRTQIEETVKGGRATSPPGSDLPYTSRAKKVLELAMTEAREIGHTYIGTEHLLLGLLREEKGIAAQVLGHNGLRLEAARAETLRLLGSEIRGGSHANTSGSPKAPPAEPTASGSADLKESLALPILAGAVVGLLAGVAGHALGLSGAAIGAVAGALAAVSTRVVSGPKSKTPPPA